MRPDEPILIAIRKAAQNPGAGAIVVDLEERYLGVVLAEDMARALADITQGFTHFAETIQDKRQQFPSESLRKQLGLKD